MLPSRSNRMGFSHVQLITYIESTGTQWINTGIAPDFVNGPDQIEITFDKASYSTLPVIFGTRATNDAHNAFYAFPTQFIAGDDSSYANVPWTSSSDHCAVVATNTTIIVNGTYYAMPKRVTCVYPMYLFCLNAQGYASLVYSGMKLYKWKYYRGTTLVQHLVPALYGGVPGMWDLVSGTFVGNSGTGVFNYA